MTLQLRDFSKKKSHKNKFPVRPTDIHFRRNKKTTTRFLQLNPHTLGPHQHSYHSSNLSRIQTRLGNLVDGKMDRSRTPSPTPRMTSGLGDTGNTASPFLPSPGPSPFLPSQGPGVTAPYDRAYHNYTLSSTPVVPDGHLHISRGMFLEEIETFETNRPSQGEQEASTPLALSPTSIVYNYDSSEDHRATGTPVSEWAGTQRPDLPYSVQSPASREINEPRVQSSNTLGPLPTHFQDGNLQETSNTQTSVASEWSAAQSQISTGTSHSTSSMTAGDVSERAPHIPNPLPESQFHFGSPAAPRGGREGFSDSHNLRQRATMQEETSAYEVRLLTLNPQHWDFLSDDWEEEFERQFRERLLEPIQAEFRQLMLELCRILRGQLADFRRRGMPAEAQLRMERCFTQFLEDEGQRRRVEYQRRWREQEEQYPTALARESQRRRNRLSSFIIFY